VRTYIRIVTGLSRVLGLLATVLLGLAVLVVCQMIVVRYFLNASTVWQTEFVIYSLVAATFLGSPYVLIRKGHVGVDLLPNALGGRWRVMLDVLAALLSLVFLAVLTWSGWNYFHEAWSGRWTTDTVWALPLWIPLLPLPVGMGLLCLQYVAEVLKVLSGEGEGPALGAHGLRDVDGMAD
jgi:TRAP-type C4-dicarboxylate transport system permease small subunit